MTTTRRSLLARLAALAAMLTARPTTATSGVDPFSPTFAAGFAELSPADQVLAINVTWGLINARRNQRGLPSNHDDDTIYTPAQLSARKGGAR